MKALYIHSASSFIGDAEADTNRLKEELNRYGCWSFRRVNRFILLSAECCGQYRTVSSTKRAILTIPYSLVVSTETKYPQPHRLRVLPTFVSFAATMGARTRLIPTARNPASLASSDAFAFTR